MPFKSLKRDMNVARQFLSEKIGVMKASEFDVEFQEVESKFQTYNDLFVSLPKSCHVILHPSRTDKMVVETVNKFTSSKHQMEYPHPENLMSVTLKNINPILTHLPIGLTLSDLSETFESILEFKYGTEDILRQDFFKPLKSVCHHEIKTILTSRKKLEKYRLDYDALKRQHSKNFEIPKQNVMKAKTKFQNKRNEVYKEMKDFVNSEDIGSGALLRFSDIQREYHERCYESLQDLTSKIKIHMATQSDLFLENEDVVNECDDRSIFNNSNNSLLF